jgi:branched-chain amino acid transport system substrate-binding protein
VRAAAFACGVLALASCTRQSGDIPIGLAGPFSESRGRSMRLAAEMAVAEINASGMLGERRLRLVIMDDSAQNARAIAVAQALKDSGVVAVVGHLTSGTTIAAADIYNGGSDPVVELSPSASNPDLTGVGRFTFRVCPTDLVHGTALATYAFEQLGARNAAIVYLNDDYGRGILGTFAEEFQRLGGTIVAQDPMLAGSDVAPYVERIARAGRAQALMIAGDRASAVAVLRAVRARGLGIPILGGDGLIGIQSEGALAEGVLLSSPYLPERPGERNAAFVRAYMAAYDGALPDHRGAGAYDAVYLIANAIRDRGARRAAIREALAAVTGSRSWEGVTGTMAFDDRGDVPDKQVVIGVVRSGRIELAGTR